MRIISRISAAFALFALFLGVAALVLLLALLWPHSTAPDIAATPQADAAVEPLEQLRQLTNYLLERSPKMDHHNLDTIRGDRNNPELAAPLMARSMRSANRADLAKLKEIHRLLPHRSATER